MDTGTNRLRYRALLALLASVDARMLVITGTQVGVNDVKLNTLADLDAIPGVSFHSERLPLTGEVITQDDANNRAVYDCADVAFAAAAGVTAQGVAVYDEGSGIDSGRDLLTVHTTGFPKPMDGGLTIAVTDLIRALVPTTS